MFKKCLISRLLLSGMMAFPLALVSTASSAEVGVGGSINFFFPNGAVRLNMGNDMYHFSEGRFFREGRRGYYLVDAPVGIRVPHLPRGYRSYYDNRYGSYYSYQDIYYRQVDNGYLVIEQPTTIVYRTVILPGRSQYYYSDDRYRHRYEHHDRYPKHDRYEYHDRYKHHDKYEKHGQKEERRRDYDERRVSDNYRQSNKDQQNRDRHHERNPDDYRKPMRDENGNMLFKSSTYRD
jgi:hypothetical protein